MQIQNYVPMWANMKARFVIDGAARAIWTGSSSTPTARRRVARGEVDAGALARAELPGAVARALSAHARDLLHRTRRGSSPATATSPARSTCSRADTTSTGTFTSASRRERLPLPVAVRLAALDAARASTSGTPARSSSAATRSSPTRSSRSAPKTRPTLASTRRYTDVDLARVHRLPQLPGLRFAGARVAAQPARMADGPVFASTAARGTLVVTPPPGVSR